MQVSVLGVDTHYEQLGKGQPLVLLHGWGCSWEIWYPVIAQLSKNYCLILPDLPAFGQSTLHSDTWNTHHYAQWLDAFITKVIGNKKFALGGHSFGGKIAAVYAATFQPERLQKLFLIDISGLPVYLPFRKHLQENVLGLIPASLKSLIPQRVRSKIVSRVGASDYAAATEQQRAIFKKIIKENIEATVSQIMAPTLLIWGENDADTPLQHAKMYERLIPQARLVVFAGVGHFPFIERPQEFVHNIQV